MTTAKKIMNSNGHAPRQAGVVKSKKLRVTPNPKLIVTTKIMMRIYNTRANFAVRLLIALNILATKNTKYTPKNVATNTVVVATLSVS